ncbi:hypothetical protein HJFPF1_05048 [Paramyrothecium foliicola]|nr:hypothetical protein HJFPF1_05048 [Paramyrothecium foliicola]
MAATPSCCGCSYGDARSNAKVNIQPTRLTNSDELTIDAAQRLSRHNKVPYSKHGHESLLVAWHQFINYTCKPGCSNQQDIRTVAASLPEDTRTKLSLLPSDNQEMAKGDLKPSSTNGQLERGLRAQQKQKQKGPPGQEDDRPLSNYTS